MLPPSLVLCLASTLQLSLLAHCLSSSNSSRQRIKGYSIPDGFSKLLFYDGFRGGAAGSLPSTKKWVLDLGTAYPGGPEHWGTNEVQIYTSKPANIAITSRKTLHITPMRTLNDSWTSARIETTPDWDFACQRGQHLRVQARIKLGGDSKDKQMGIWPAFWALGSAFRGNFLNWPGVGEIDILESINGEPKVHHVAHCGNNPGGSCNEPSGISNVSDSIRRGQWHTYSWEVDRRTCGNGTESMSWSIDGFRQWTLEESDIGNASAWDTLVGGKKMLLLNVAVGGAFPDAIAGFKTPTDATIGGKGSGMEVDYVAIYT